MEPNVIIGIVAAIVVIAVIAIVWYLHSRRSADRKPQQEQSPTAAVGGDQPASAREPGRPESAEPEAPGQSATSASAGNAPESSAVTEPAAASAVATQTPVQPALDKPEGARSRIERLRAKLARSSNPFGKALFNILAKDNLSEADWEDVEDTLLLADVGAEASAQLVDELRTDSRITGTADPAQVREALRSKLLDLVGPDTDRRLNANKEGANTPSVIIMVGVNGTGKTTTAGKLARLFVADGKRVMMGAADTFRAAAADQLETWGAKVGVPVVRSDKDGADPASVAFEAAARAKDEHADVLIIDTAGRLQNKANLMDELGKIRRVTEKNLPVDEMLLVLDATTGQNGMAQAKVFAEAIGITGVVLSKLDGSAKGGIVISVQKELGVPVKLVGLGEGPDDLAPFDPEGFVDGILA
ncbi:signal recognition particle-docking protein FtsY [Bifidobacterium pullorum subsp. saeculare]|nr:signal recognition particle-docking protein FtsY [Bifidobacterium pullorum]MBM6695830.1 signal recognition particle-docking protein FtsY [Bifidobacterium pullorum subsp. saeculare]